MKRVILLSGMALWLLSCGSNGENAGEAGANTTTVPNTTNTTDAGVNAGMDTGTGTGMGSATVGADTMAGGNGAGGTDTTLRNPR